LKRSTSFPEKLNVTNGHSLSETAEEELSQIIILKSHREGELRRDAGITFAGTDRHYGAFAFDGISEKGCRTS
jgi:hypothetical protein